MGSGVKYIKDLLRKCGRLDVVDCIAMVEGLIHLGLSEPGRQVVQGGSPRGFLTAHRKSQTSTHSQPIQHLVSYRLAFRRV